MIEDKPVFKSLRDFMNRSDARHAPEQFMNSLEGESDRGAVILAVTFIEDALDDVLSSINIAKKKSKNFNDKIKSAFEAEIINLDIRDKLHAVRLIRNACAHSRSGIDFSTPELRDAMSELLVQSPEAPPIASLPPSLMRKLFVGSCLTLSITIIGIMDI